MKILLLAQKIPYPLHDGYNLHNYQYSRLLSERHEVHLVAIGAGPAPREHHSQFASMRIVPQREVPSAGTRWRRLAHALSVDELYDFDPEVFRALEAVLAQGGFDVLWVSGAKMMVYSDRVRGVPVLGDVADDGAVHTWHEFLRSRTPLQFLRRGKEFWLTRRYERKFFAHAAVCNVVAEDDRASIARLVPGMDVSVINNGVDAEYFRPLGAREEFPTLVFEGGMSYPPNAEGAVDFCRHVFPLILQGEPRARFVIVGKDPPDEVRALAGPQVEVTGFVEDVRPYLDRATLFVCPLVTGAGIKNKILQAWAMQKAVVATPMSCGGLRSAPGPDAGPNIVVAQGHQAFAAEVLRLLGDEPLRKRLGESGRATVLAHYSWRAKAAELESVMGRVAAARRSAVP
jgi:glycosyltransferase involved in cell wall biosynthesis